MQRIPGPTNLFFSTHCRWSVADSFLTTDRALAEVVASGCWGSGSPAILGDEFAAGAAGGGVIRTSEEQTVELTQVLICCCYY